MELSIRKLSTLVALLALAASCVLACSRKPRAARAAPGVALASITVTSPSFAEGGSIPVDNTCDGKDVLPELVFSAPPENTRSITVIIDDPDAPSGLFTHMIAFDIAPGVHELTSGSDLAGAGAAARFGLNDFHVTHYSGPCPPHGEVHRYRFRVLALDTMLNLPEGASRARVEQAMDGHVLGEGTLTANFGH